MGQWPLDGQDPKIRRLGLLLLLAGLLQAHVGNPDIFLDTQAGPYKLFITIRPPAVIPGVAELEVRSESEAVHDVRAVPIPLTRQGTAYAPVPEALRVDTHDPQFFTGSLWMMGTGSWQIRIIANGAQGQAVVAVPVPSVARTVKPLGTGLTVILFGLMCLLIAGIVLIVGASVREAKLPPGVAPGGQRIRQARVTMVVTFLVVFALTAAGHRWWKVSEANYRNKVYKPLEMSAAVSRQGTLTLRMRNPEWMNQPFRNVTQNGPALFTRVMDDLVPDHGHLMHLYAIRQPAMDAVYHLHPELTSPATFQLQLPSMRPGTYKLYADVVHANGFAETMVSQATVPEGLPQRPLVGDDAKGGATAWMPGKETTRFTLPDGFIMQWVRPPAAFHARTGNALRFRLLDPQGQPAQQMQFYMGMLGHAAFVKTDGSTFAHVHPTGSVAMAAYYLAQSQIGRQSASQTADTGMAGMSMPGMEMPGERQTGSLPNEVAFPYGFPAPGQYRIFVQMKHAGRVETGVFDTSVIQ